jgi:hypothetical protein
VIWFHGGGEPEEVWGQSVTSGAPDRLMFRLVTAAGFNRAATWCREVGGCGGREVGDCGGRQKRRLDGWASMDQKRQRTAGGDVGPK